jgi:hypothetical protein
MRALFTIEVDSIQLSIFLKITEIELITGSGSTIHKSRAHQALEFAKQNNSEITTLYISFIPFSLRFKSTDILDAAHQSYIEELTQWLEDIRKEAENNTYISK